MIYRMVIWMEMKTDKRLIQHVTLTERTETKKKITKNAVAQLIDYNDVLIYDQLMIVVIDEI